MIQNTSKYWKLTTDNKSQSITINHMTTHIYIYITTTYNYYCTCVHRICRSEKPSACAATPGKLLLVKTLCTPTIGGNLGGKGKADVQVESTKFILFFWIGWFVTCHLRPFFLSHIFDIIPKKNGRKKHVQTTNQFLFRYLATVKHVCSLQLNQAEVRNCDTSGTIVQSLRAVNTQTVVVRKSQEKPPASKTAAGSRPLLEALSSLPLLGWQSPHQNAILHFLHSPWHLRMANQQWYEIRLVQGLNAHIFQQKWMVWYGLLWPQDATVENFSRFAFKAWPPQA